MVEPRIAQRLKKPVHERLVVVVPNYWWKAVKKASENSLFQGDQTTVEDRACNVRWMALGSVERRWKRVEREG